ncbi:MAG: sulfatase-like hydrolase/transferase [Pirellulales bacterium]|nr:sulfatase-like hydrolase/transferase [Pirellulales bacterium]
MNAICLVIDRWHLGHVGAYGNAWIETPSFDRMACEAFTFDQALISSPRTNEFYRSLWQGRHPLLRDVDSTPAADLPRQLAQARIATTLMTDELAVANHPLAAGFDELVGLDPPERITAADDVGATHLAGCFAQIIDWLGAAEGPFMLWVHLSSMANCWDAPYSFRERYVEPGDPDPPHSAEVPQLILPDGFDPDTLLGITQSYAAQVSVLDACFGALLESLDESPTGRDTLLAVLSARGFPLGEHRQVGARGETLHSELVHVPMMIRLPDALGAARRSQALVAPADLGPTLTEWWSLDGPGPAGFGHSLLPIVRGEAPTIRDRLMLGSPTSETALRTPAWYMRLSEPPRLYVKPDDRWEVNDVADRCSEVVEELQAAAGDFQSCLQSNRLDSLQPLGEILRNGLD